MNNITHGTQNSLWFSTDDGVIIRRKNEFYSFNEHNGLTNNIVTKIAEDRRSNIWIATSRGGLQKLSLGKFKNFSEKMAF